MNWRVKTVGLTLVGVLAASAMAAAAAQASSFDIAAGTTKNVGWGGEQTFDTGSSKIACSEVTGETTEFNSEAVKVTPVYPTGKCTAFGFATHVIVKGPAIFRANRTLELTAAVHLTPTFLGSSVCTVSLSAGTYNIHAYDNSATAPMQSTATISTGTEIPFEEEAGGSCGAGKGTGSYTGNITVEGKNASNERTDITWTE